MSAAEGIKAGFAVDAAGTLILGAPGDRPMRVTAPEAFALARGFSPAATAKPSRLGVLTS